MRENIPQAVLGLSARQDAVVQLTLAGDVGAAQAARQFSSQGVRVPRSGQEPINGLPAIVTLFDAATPQGAVRGVVAHIVYRGRTYQLLAYTSVQRYASYDGLFAQVRRSFAPLTDRSILGIQPQRLDVVRLTEDMSVAEFSRRYDSVIPAGELAIINHVEGPDSGLEAGMLVKRVVG